MKIAAHITFFHLKTRYIYLQQVIEALKTVPADVTVYIYTNEPFPAELAQLHPNIVVLEFPYKRSRALLWPKFLNAQWIQKYSFPFSRAFNWTIYYFFKFLGLKRFLHPFYLSWESRAVMKNKAKDYDAQMYLEDDMGFGKEAFEYWQRYNELCIRHGYNLGFLRIENDAQQKYWITDLMYTPKNIIELEGQPFLLNDVNSYYAFWIYSKAELAKFIQTPEWNFRSTGTAVREKAAFGWHFPNMKHYKGTLIPLLKQADGSYIADPGCALKHLPNNYIGDKEFCQLEFPLLIGK